MSSVLAASQASTTLAPTRTGKHCLEQPDAKVLLSHTLGGQVNPVGIEHQLALSLCVPFIRRPGILFDFSNIEIGVFNYLAPVYVHQGGFISLVPLAVMKLRAEVSGFGVWSIPAEGAGYYTFSSYDDDSSEEARPLGEGGTATGSIVTLSATLQGKISLPRGAALLVADTFLGELWTVGDAPFYHNLRRDVVLARSDWVVKNSGAVIAEIPVSDNISVRIGVTDETTLVPGSGYTTNLVAGVGTLLIKHIGKTINNFQPIVRLGAYTHHGSATEYRRREFNALFVINTIYDLATIEGEDSAPASPSGAKAP